MANLAEERLARSKVDASIDFAAIHDEPKLREMFNDPIMRRLMASDGIDRRNLVRMLGETRAKLVHKRR
jgi:hypothetical protein